MSEEYKPINNLWKDSKGYRYFGTLKLSSKIKYNGDDLMPLWEWVEQLQQENQQLKEYKNIALKYMKNYLLMDLRYQNEEVANKFKMVINMLNRGEINE